MTPLDFAEWVQALGAWGPLAFVAGYLVVTVLMMPAFLLTLAAGALWGFWLGLLLAMTGAVLGATCAFLGARSVVRGVVERYVARHPRLVAIDRAVEAEGARLVLLLRMSPAVPFVLLNYVLGVSRISLRDHFVGLVGMIPTAAMYVYAGKVAGDLAALASGAPLHRGPAYYVLITLGLAATVVATVLITRAARRALEDRHHDLR
ncbi:MAG TPA: TVP38/TMEM64 family protein [Vicinamibacterales bacterium]|nr:TVP38/TMEM64 family protein [Vicinamibacterales bacterium]